MRKRLKIFVASPGDVDFLRDLVVKVVGDINDTFGRFNPCIETFMWEYDTEPGYADIAQIAIDRSAGDSFDIFLGLLWHRFGTPVLAAGSGFEHEYLRAIKLFKEKNPELKVWMCRYGANLPQKDVVPQQFAALEAFLATHQNKWIQLGIKRGTINSKAKFESVLRKELLRLVPQAAQQEPDPTGNLKNLVGSEKLRPIKPPR